jgi:hypothetical protein
MNRESRDEIYATRINMQERNSRRWMERRTRQIEIRGGG